MNTLGKIRNVISNEDNTLLAHQGREDVDEVLHIEARDQWSQLDIDQRSIHISGTNKLVLANVELGSVLGKRSVSALTNKVKHLFGLQTKHGLRDLQNMRENCEIGSKESSNHF